MMVSIFDDKKSVVHLFAGMLSVFSIAFLVVFVLYETAEFIYKRRRKKEFTDDFVGDLLEFLCGYSFVNILAEVAYGGGWM